MNKLAGLSDVMMLLPGVGGGLHGIVDPEEGAFRLETALVEGVGGATGTGAGALLGALALSKYGDPGMSDDARNTLLLAASALGSAGGSKLGRLLVKREQPKQEDKNINIILQQLKEQGAL